MKALEFILANAEYLARTVPGSLVHTVKLKQPWILEHETNADLHVHPYITSTLDLKQTLDTMTDNRVDMLAITTHGPGTGMDYWAVKKMAKDLMRVEDRGFAFRMKYRQKTLTIVGAYEMRTQVPGVRGKMDCLALMPDKGFEKKAKDDMQFDDYVGLCRESRAIVVGAHPYTLHDPYGPNGFFRFRLAMPDERAAIRKQVVITTESVDLVSTNCAWMLWSNKLVREDYWELWDGEPLSNSDAHATNESTRREIGRSGNLFELDEWYDGEGLRRQLSLHIKLGDFEPYTNYTPALQFLESVAFNRTLG